MSSEPFPTLAELLADARWVRGLASTLAANAHDADDLAQEACLLALRQPPRDEHNLRGWFQTVLTNLVRQGVRARVRREQREQQLAAGAGTGSPTHDLVERAATHRAVVDAVLNLDHPYRDTILLRFFEDMPPRSIASRMGVSVATVHSRLQRGCARLRQHLDRTFGRRSTWRAAFLPLPLAAPLPLGALVMNAKIVSVAATVVIGTAALWFGLQAGGSADTPVRAHENAAPVAQDVERRPAQPPAVTADQRQSASAEPGAATSPQLRRIGGHVVDTEGRPAATVSLKFDDARARSDSAGAFTFATAGHDAGIVRTDEPGWRTVMHSVVPASATPPPALVVAAPALAIAGEVRSSAGEPVAGATLRVVWPNDLRNRLSVISDTSAEEDMCTRSRTDGSFALDAARVRGAQLAVTAEGFVPERRPLPEQDTKALRITLEQPLGKPGTIQGQVVDPHGRPVAEARIALGAAVVRSDAQGNFLIDDDGKSRTLAAAMVGHRRGTVDRTSTGFPAFVVVALGAVPLSIRGRVVDQDGKGLPGVTIWAKDPTLLCDSRELLVVEGIAAGFTSQDELRARFERGEFGNQTPEQVMRNTATTSWPFVQSGDDGAFVLNGLEDRAYRLRAMDPVTALLVERDAVAAGSEDVKLALRQDDLFTTLRGIVVARSGEPVPGVRVQVQIDTLSLGHTTMHGRSEARDTTDAEGRFTLPNVPKRHVYLRLDGDRILPVEHGRGVEGGLLALLGGRVDDVRIEVGVRMHVQVELLDPGSADTLAVLDGAGKTIIVNVFSGRGRRETDGLELADGKSPVFVVPDTAATLILKKDGKEVRRETLTLRAGDVNTLRY